MWHLFVSIGSDLPEIEGSVLVSVISDEEHQRRKELLERLLNS
jgi:hypothetical protein